jgi:DNA-binding transcriptional LysR family regulator
MRDLEYLVTVASSLHFGKAAQELGVSQPTLSEQIKKLEFHLSVKIFERTNRSVRLTDEGRSYIESAQKILEEAKVFVGLNNTWPCNFSL